MNKRYLKLKQLTYNRKLFFKFINLLTNDISNKQIENWCLANENANIYPSSISLARKKVDVANKNDLSVLDLFRGKIKSSKPIHQEKPINVLTLELGRIARAIKTGTENNEDKKELPALLRLSENPNHIDFNPKIYQ